MIIGLHWKINIGHKEAQMGLCTREGSIKARMPINNDGGDVNAY